jgi:hypothetical protein
MPGNGVPVSRIPGMAPNAPKRNLLVLILYLLGLGVVVAALDVTNPELAM